MKIPKIWFIVNRVKKLRQCNASLKEALRIIIKTERRINEDSPTKVC